MLYVTHKLLVCIGIVMYIVGRWWENTNIREESISEIPSSCCLCVSLLLIVGGVSCFSALPSLKNYFLITVQYLLALYKHSIITWPIHHISEPFNIELKFVRITISVKT